MNRNEKNRFARLQQGRKAAVDYLQRAGAAVGLGFVAVSAHAAIDVTAITSVIADVVTAAATVGAAALAMHYGIKAYKWLRAAG